MTAYFDNIVSQFNRWKKDGKIVVEEDTEYEWEEKWIYVISEPESVSTKGYKVGFHSGTEKDLRKRYITAMPRIRIHAFIPGSLEAEKRLKEQWRVARV